MGTSDDNVALERIGTPSPFVTKTIEAPEDETRSQRLRRELAWPFKTYFATRLGLLALVFLCDVIFSGVGKTSLAHEIGNWDGFWYIRVATIGYPPGVSHAQTTLGFFPLYPMAIWLVSHAFMCAYVIGGLIVSMTGGFIATVLVGRLAREWWGPEVAKKAILLFCLFPGSIVFSMDYSEGILIPLVAGCMIALHKRRWLLAGILAAFATAIGPDALAIVPMCGVASLLQLWRYGWRDAEARRSLIAPLLSPGGAIAFAVFLKIWTGSALASYTAQADGWNEKTTIFAIPAQLVALINSIGPHLHWWNINVNYLVGLAGAAFLVVGLRFLWRERWAIPPEVLVFTAAMAFFTLTSAHVPPNPRMLITAFPVVIVFAKWLHGRAWTRFIWVTGAVCLVMSILTYVGSILRP